MAKGKRVVNPKILIYGRINRIVTLCKTYNIGDNMAQSFSIRVAVAVKNGQVKLTPLSLSFSSSGSSRPSPTPGAKK
jgi:hypothetical protein